MFKKMNAFFFVVALILSSQNILANQPKRIVSDHKVKTVAVTVSLMMLCGATLCAATSPHAQGSAMANPSLLDLLKQ